MARLSNSSWRANAFCIACGLLSHIPVEPSMSVNRNVTVPVGGLATTLMSSLLPLRGHYSSAAFSGPSVYPPKLRPVADDSYGSLTRVRLHAPIAFPSSMSPQHAVEGATATVHLEEMGSVIS